MHPYEGPEHPDKLSHFERLRLEALTQAITYRGRDNGDAKEICKDADTFAAWIKGEPSDTDKLIDLQGQLERLAQFITESIPGEPSQSQGVIDTAIRLLAAAYPTEEASTPPA